MRACKAVLALAGLALTVGAVHASSQQGTLRISMTIVDRCDVRNGSTSPSVDCSIGVPWTVAPAAAPASRSLVADGNDTRHFPVPSSGPADEARVTTIVF